MKAAYLVYRSSLAQALKCFLISMNMDGKKLPKNRGLANHKEMFYAIRLRWRAEPADRTILQNEICESARFASAQALVESL